MAQIRMTKDAKKIQGREQELAIAAHKYKQSIDNLHRVEEREANEWARLVIDGEQVTEMCSRLGIPPELTEPSRSTR